MNIKSLKETIQFISDEEFSNLSTQQLIDTLPTFGLNDEVLYEQPTSLEPYFGHGLKIWQYPIQMAPFIKWLQTVNVNSYLEIGVRWGGNFIVVSEILKRNNPNINLFACDLIKESDILTEYRDHSDFIYLNTKSTSNLFRSLVQNYNMDMVYIDGDHSYEGCLSDYLLFKNNPNTKYIVFHDIDSVACPGVVQIWNDVKNDPQFTALEFTQQYPKDLIPARQNYLGIGVLIRK